VGLHLSLPLLAWLFSIYQVDSSRFSALAPTAVRRWREGDGPSWILSQQAWREWGLVIRSASGLLMLWVSVVWLMERRAT